MVDNSTHRNIGRVLTVGMVLAVLALSSAGPAVAEDLKGRWYFGGNLGFLSTTDDIRSNAAIIIGRPGDDGIPFTGDPNEDQGCPINQRFQNISLFCDPREDDLLGRENTIEETFRLEATAGYGITSWLSLQLDVSYFKGDVGPIDAFRREARPFRNPLTTGFQGFRDFDEVITLDAGEVTEIPVSLSGIIRFRKDSPLNPYIGVGAGMIFTEIDPSGDLNDLNLRLGRLRITGLTNERGKDLSNPDILQPVRLAGRIPLVNPVSIDIEDAFEWHLMGGAEWFFNDRVSLVFDARYMYTDQDIEIDLGGEDQVNFTIWAEGLFRKDGSVRFFKEGGASYHPIDPDTLSPVQCDPNVDNGKDIDGDGQRGDFCYADEIANNPSRRGVNTPVGIFVVQGGNIELSAFSASVGVRFHF